MCKCKQTSYTSSIRSILFSFSCIPRLMVVRKRLEELRVEMLRGEDLSLKKSLTMEIWNKSKPGEKSQGIQRKEFKKVIGEEWVVKRCPSMSLLLHSTSVICQRSGESGNATTRRIWGTCGMGCSGNSRTKLWTCGEIRTYTLL